MKRVLLLVLVLAMLSGAVGGAVAWAKAGDNGSDEESPLADHITSHVGGTFEIVLDSNPTAGYSWQVEYDETHLELVDQTFQASSDLIGAGGTETFVFEALRDGETKVTMVYKRPWEQDVLRTKAFVVVVQPKLIEVGVLQGRVTIGPISPVERPGENPPIPPEVYESRKVMIYDQQRGQLVSKVDLDPDGYYRVALIPDIYVVDINYAGVDSSSDVPRKVEIRPGETLEVNIDIDTGIR